MMSLTIVQVQTEFNQAIDFVQTGKSLTITQNGEPKAMLLSFKEGSELLRLRHVVRLEGLLSCTVKESPSGRVTAVYRRH